MRRTTMQLFLIVLLLPATVFAASQEDLRVSGPQQAAKVSYQTMEDGKLLVSVIDDQENPILGLTARDFAVKQGLKTAKILSAEPLATSKEIGLNIVMVIDNSMSMQMRHAVDPLSQALEAFYKTLRPIDRVYAVVFDDRQTSAWQGRNLHARLFQADSVPQLRSFVNQSLTEGLTNGTYLYDAMVLGLDQVRNMPEKSNKFMVVFSDGEDINSGIKRTEVEKQADGIANFSAYAVDYMPGAKVDPFLGTFSGGNNGKVWKATSATELLPVFKAFSSTLLRRYVLHQDQLRGAMEKYSQVLDIIGQRLQDDPEAKVRLVGCNSDIGEEKGRTDLSLQRAEAVRAYLQYIWGVDAARMTVEKRNLPAAPSSNRTTEGQMENQRVEIYSDHASILDTVNSEYVQKVSDREELQILPEITSEAGIADWKVTLDCGERTLQVFEGNGDLPPRIVVPLEATLLEQMTTCGSVRSTVQAVDKEANALDGQAQGLLPVHFVQRKEQMAQVQGYKVKEQYALILFDYDSADIKERNQAVVDRIMHRINEVPDALVSVVGHTDILGKEEYNQQLSQRRAGAVQAQLLKSAPQLAEKLHVAGVGPQDPMFDNNLPEGRALNRTVTITLEYLQNPQQ
ncbi:MAG: OmpA family protein [Desulfosarcinaceae bacterium]